MSTTQLAPDVALAVVQQAQKVLRHSLEYFTGRVRNLKREQDRHRHYFSCPYEWSACRTRERWLDTAYAQMKLYEQALDALDKGDYQPIIDILSGNLSELKEPPGEANRLKSRQLSPYKLSKRIPSFRKRMIILRSALIRVQLAGE